MLFPLHKDDRGSFQELVHSKDIEFGQLSLLKVNVGCSRGDHYHMHKLEWFACIHGKCTMQMSHVRGNAKRQVELDESHIEFIQIMPYERHKVINTGEAVCELLVIASESFNPLDPDTFGAGT